MKKSNKIIVRIALGIFVFIGGSYLTYWIMNNAKEYEETTGVENRKRVEAMEEMREESFEKGGESTEVVNEPVDKSIVTMADGSDGHTFVSYYHDFYNETLTYGKLEASDYNPERQAGFAQEILSKLDGFETTNQELKLDFDKIKYEASLVTIEDHPETLRQLHRLFHDLDIYFNGYSYHQTWGVTDFTGE
jgi:hypothetical protein